MKKALCVILCAAIVFGIAVFPAHALDPGKDLPKGPCQVFYEFEDQTVSQTVTSGKNVVLRSEYGMRQDGDRILVGWKAQDGTEYYYDNTDFWRPDGKTDLVLQSGESCKLTPIWVPISIRKEEVFSFTNSESVFNADLDGYVFTRRHFMRILPNWFCTFALSPFAPLAAFGVLFFLFIWPNMDFYGSCSGFAICTLLQHYGKIDMLSEQGVDNVCDLEPDDSVQSIINYYNIHAVASMLTDNNALVPGTDEYRKQLHDLYNTLEGGTPVYFELYGDYPHLLRVFLTHPADLITDFDNLTAHGVLLTGAYTDGNGNHILIMYDSNSRDYVNGTCDVIYIDPDFTNIYSSYGDSDDVLNGFTWNDDIAQFDAFKTEGISNPFAWHVRFLQKVPSLLRQILPLYKTK